jgi:predicted dehydrogenase
MKKIGFGIIGCGKHWSDSCGCNYAAPHAKLIAVSDVVERML